MYLRQFSQPQGENVDKFIGITVGIAALVGIAAGGTYLAKSYRVDCLDWFVGRTCAVTQR
jgi:hypothetical protein